MEGLIIDMLKVKVALLANKLVINKLITFVAFIFLIAAIIFIQLHPYSVWYYFAAGFFLCRMLELICQKTAIKYYMQDAISNLKKVTKGII